MVVRDMGWVDYDFGNSTVCQVLPRQMGVWQHWHSKMVEHPKSRSTQPMSLTTIVTL